MAFAVSLLDESKARCWSIRFSGLVFLSDSTIATVCFTSLADYTNGAGTFTFFPILDFDDGSVLWLKSMGTGTVERISSEHSMLSAARADSRVLKEMVH